MEQKRIDRINELARLSKTRELTAQEKQEQQLLREEYVASFRASLRAQLDSCVIVHPDGRKESVRNRRKH